MLIPFGKNIFYCCSNDQPKEYYKIQNSQYTTDTVYMYLLYNLNIPNSSITKCSTKKVNENFTTVAYCVWDLCVHGK